MALHFLSSNAKALLRAGMEIFLFYYIFVTEAFKKVEFLSFPAKGLVRNPHNKRICRTLHFIH